VCEIRACALKLGRFEIDNMQLSLEQTSLIMYHQWSMLSIQNVQQIVQSLRVLLDVERQLVEQP
jgi:hypothetical protein